MAALGKNLGKFKQWAGEKIGNAAKTETDSEFKIQLHEMAKKCDLFDALYSSSLIYLATIHEKKKGSDKTKQLPIENFGHNLVSFGSTLDDSSAYGQALIKAGECHEDLGLLHSEFAGRMNEEYIARIEVFQNQCKEFLKLKGKLNSRRLDYDAKMNKVKNAKKENPALEEEMRAAQAKYEETLSEMRRIMDDAIRREDEDLETLANFIDIEKDFYQRSLQKLTSLSSTLKDSNVLAQRRRVPTAEIRRSTSRASSIDRAKGVGVDVTENSNFYSEPITPIVSGTVDPLPGVAAFIQPTAPAIESPKTSIRSVAPPPTPPRLVQRKAIFQFDAENSDELSIDVGDIITVLKEAEDGWWEGEMVDHRGRRTGLFPANYTQPLELQASVSSVQETLPTYQNQVQQQQQQLQQELQRQLSQSQATQRPSSPTRALPKPEDYSNPFEEAEKVSDGMASPKVNVATKPTGLGDRPMTFTATPNQMAKAFNVVNSVTNPGSASVPTQVPLGDKPMTITATPKQIGSAFSMARTMAGKLDSPGGGSRQGPCSVCGCNEWAANVFKPHQCNNCFHPH